MTQMSETQEPWDIEDARRAEEISFDQEIEAAIRSAKEKIEAARRECDVCLYDRHCASHCAEDCEHRSEPDSEHSMGCQCPDCTWMFL